jgi:hypothetical protein
MVRYDSDEGDKDDPVNISSDFNWLMYSGRTVVKREEAKIGKLGVTAHCPSLPLSFVQFRVRLSNICSASLN